MILYTQRACGALYRYACANRGTYIIPANSCPVVPLTFLKAGCKIEFVDICQYDYCIDRQKCLSMVKEQVGIYAGLLFIHTYGLECDISSFRKSLKLIDSGIKVIDDRCLCLPQLDADIVDGIDFILYSTGYAKSANLGYGGFSVSEEFDYELAEELTFVGSDYDGIDYLCKRLLALESFYDGETFNRWLDSSLMDKSFICQYREQLSENLEKSERHKKRLNQIYDEYLPNGIKLPPAYQGWRFNVLLDNSKEVLQSLMDSGLFASKHYQPSGYLFGRERRFTRADKLYADVINLFNDFYYTEKQAYETCKVINQNLT